jgi:hypothetical protein
MTMKLVELFQKASPRELREVQAVLAEQPRQKREVLAEEDRCRITGELRERLAAVSAAREAAQLEISKLEAQRDQVLHQLRFACSRLDAATPYDLGQWLEERRAALWEGRPALVDVLISRLLDEARGLAPSEATIKPERLGYESRASNRESVERRRTALRDLAQRLVPSWTRNGEFVSEAEFKRLFDQAYRDLPKVEPAEAVARRIAQQRDGLDPLLPPAA